MSTAVFPLPAIASVTPAPPESLLWPGEPIRISDGDLDRLFAWCAQSDGSDIRLQTNQPVWLQRHGRIFPVTRRTLTDGEVEAAVNRLYGADGLARLKAGQDYDVSYEIQPDRNTRRRFRVNATAIMSRGTDGAAIVARVLPDKAPHLKDLRVEQGILGNFKISKGFVIVSGATENGKSTLLAAMVRDVLEDENGNRWVLELAAPIEFVFDDIKCRSGGISQTEIPRHLPSFAAGARNAVRRNPKAVVIGECRDTETMTVACQLSIAGAAVMTTVHAGSVSETIERMVSLCPAGERAAVTVQLAQSLRLIINQRLVPSLDGRRTALREFLVFDDSLRRRLLTAPPDRWAEIATEALKTDGQSYGVAVATALSERRISEETAFLIRKEFGDVA